MKKQLILLLMLVLHFCSCSTQNRESKNVIDEQNEVSTKDIEANKNVSITTDSLIAELANMKTDTLDCTADIYWQIIGKGKSYIPKLIEGLTDTTPTSIYHGCKNKNLNIGELSYFALEEIGDFPAFVVTEYQFDVVRIKNGWHCWSFYDYLFDNSNKKEYQEKMKAFYEKSNFSFIEYPDSIITNCMRKYSIKGKYKWKK